MKSKIILGVIIFVYTLSILYFVQYYSYKRNGYETLNKERWAIIIACTLCIEILNQITYLMAKRNKMAAERIKVLFFWIIFTIGTGIYILLLSRLEISDLKTDVFYWWSTLTKPIVVVCLIFYSFSVKIRFIALVGNFKKHSELHN